jgi:hypothetical protein
MYRDVIAVATLSFVALAISRAFVRMVLAFSDVASPNRGTHVLAV